MSGIQLLVERVTFASLGKIEGLIGPLDLTTEIYREYDYGTGRTYRINDPVALYRREGGATPRVVDTQGRVHCVPCGPQCPDTVIRWVNKDPNNPVSW